MWAAMLGSMSLLVAALTVPRIVGATPLTVLSGSMEPSLPPGALVVVRPVPAEDVGIGSVITYQLRSGEPTVVTHRVVGQTFGPDGSPLFQTQGDANDSPDAAWVRPVQIRGEVWYSIPHLGRVANLLSIEERGVAARVLGGGLAGYAVALLLRAVRQRRRTAEPRGAHVAA